MRAKEALLQGRDDNLKGDGSSSEENSVVALFPHCKEVPAKLCFKWIDMDQATAAITGAEEGETSNVQKNAPFVNPLAFQKKNFDKAAYFRAIEKT